MRMYVPCMRTYGPASKRMLGHASVWADQHGHVHMKRVCVRMNTGRACMHDACARMNVDREVPSTFSSLPLFKTHPKHVPTPYKAPGFHLDPPHNETQAFTSTKID